MSEAAHWDQRYRRGDSPWDTGQPSSELRRLIAEERIAPARALELGCGTGTNAIWLAQQGFAVTALDVSALALEWAREKAARAGVAVRFMAGDALDPPEMDAPFRFVFDRGCYHVVRRHNATRFAEVLHRLTTPDMTALVLAGNAKEPHAPGPPVVSEEEIRRELGGRFVIQWLREFRFDPPPGREESFLAWSCRLRKRNAFS